MQITPAALGMTSLAISKNVRAGDFAVSAVKFGGNGTFNHADELARVFFHSPYEVDPQPAVPQPP